MHHTASRRLMALTVLALIIGNLFSSWSRGEVDAATSDAGRAGPVSQAAGPKFAGNPAREGAYGVRGTVPQKLAGFQNSRHLKPLRRNHSGSACPSPWSCGDIGQVPTAGSDSYDSTTGTWSLTGSGDMGNPADAFNGVFIAYGNVSNVTISAHVASLSGTGTDVRAGIMFREAVSGLPSPTTYFYAVLVDTAGHVSIEYRNVPGEVDTVPITTTAGQYIQIRREAIGGSGYGFNFEAYSSTTGAAGSFTPVNGSGVTLIGDDIPYTSAGMFVLSGNNTLTTASIDTLSGGGTTGPPVSDCPQPWSCADIGGPNEAGDQHATTDSYAWALEGAGYGFIYNSGTTNGTDQFRYVWQPATPGTVMTARVIFHRNQAGGSEQEAGLMFRLGLGGATQYFGVLVRAGKGVVAQHRDCGYVPGHCSLGFPATCTDNVDSTTTPVWLKMSWGGGVAFQAWGSSDGITWNAINCPVSADTFWLNQPVYFGMVDSGTNEMGVATFDHVAAVSPPAPTPTGAGSCSCTATTVSSQLPVNEATGNFSHTFQDFAIPGRGPFLHFDHSYQSFNAGQDSPLGFGWTDSYNMFLSTDTNGTVYVHESGGTILPFYLNGSTYQAPGWVRATLAKNPDGTFTYLRGLTQEQYVFSAPTQTVAGQLLREADRNGNTTTLSYNSGKLTTVTSPAGQTLTLAYNTANRIASVTDSSSRAVYFNYDSSGNLTSVQDIAGNLTQFTYSASHQLLTMTDPRGTVVKNVYDNVGRVSQQVLDPTGLNRKTSFAFSLNSDGSHTTTITDPLGHVTTQVYSAMQLQSITEASGTAQAATTTLTYDPNTFGITSIQDPNNHTWTATYDGSGNLLTLTDPLNNTSTYTYDAMNDLTSARDPSGVTTSLSYDARGNLLQVTRPLVGTSQTATAQIAYGDASNPGLPTQITDPNGGVTTIAYDANGNTSRVTSPAGEVTNYGYNTIGLPISIETPRGTTVGPASAFTANIAYDAYGDITSITDPLGNQTRYAFDADGNLTSSVDALSHTTTMAYDSLGEVTSVTQPDLTTSTYTYDADGNQITSTDGLNHSVTYTYDALGQPATVKDALNRTTTYGYDAAGNVTSIVDALQRTTSYTYDAADRLTNASFSDGTTPSISLGYDQDSNITSMTDGTGTSSFAYDSLGRLTQNTDGAGNTVKYAYDLNGNVTTLTYPDSSTVTRAYDRDNRPISLTDWQNHVTTFAYDADSNLSAATYPNNSTAALTYDNADQLTQLVYSLRGSPYWTYSYGHDANGQLTSAVDPGDGQTHTYSYDQLNRLTADARTSPGTTSWSYDAADQLTSITDPTNGTSTLQYDVTHELTNMTTVLNGVTTHNIGMSYNANGDRTTQTDSVTGTSSTFAYNQADQLIRFTSGATAASYTYDGTGLRTGKTVNGTTTHQVWDLAEGAPLLLQDGSTKFAYGPSGLPLEQLVNSAVNFLYQDQQGSTRAMADMTLSQSGYYNYDAYGKVRSHTGTLSTPFQYASQYTDAESGLQYLPSGYYDPSTAQYLTPEATGSAYSYADDNPESNRGDSGNSGGCQICGVAGPIMTTGGSGTNYLLRTGNTGKYFILSREGEVKFGYQGKKWMRYFHLDAPHGKVTRYHLNADVGVLRRPKWPSWWPVVDWRGESIFDHMWVPRPVYYLGWYTPMRLLSGAASIAGVGLSGYSILSASCSERPGAIGSAIGGEVGGVIGGVVGTEWGGPGPGTWIGATGGSVFGSVVGGWIGNEFGAGSCCS